MLARALCVAGKAYLVLGGIALALIPANAVGWLGEPDPLSAVPALVLSLPWSLIASSLLTLSPSSGWVLFVAGIGVNGAAVLAMGRWLARRS